MSLTKIPGFALDTTSNVTFANANVSGNLTASNANLGNAVTANYFIGNGSLLTGLPASYSNTNVASYLPTFTGNLTAGNANLGNLVVANFHSGNGSLLTSLTGANVTGQVGNSLIAGTVYTNAQPNITSVGTLTSLVVTGNITSGNANLGNLAKANYFQGDGSLITNIGGASYIVNGTSNLYVVNNGNIVANVGSNNTLTITSTGVNVTGYTSITGNLSASNLSLTGNVTSTLNVTGNANVGNLNTAGNVNANNLILTGNLTVGGTTTYVNSTVTNIVDPIVELGGGANAALLTTGDGKDRGLFLHRYEGVSGSGGKIVDSFMGWSNSAYEYIFASNATVSSEVVTVNSYGNVHANYFIGNGSALTGISATTAVSLVNGNSNVVVTANGNVTFGVGGNASMLTVTNTGANFGGHITTTGNISAGNSVSANYFVGSGQYLTGLGSLSNGNSNISIVQNGNLIFSAVGQYGVLQVSGTGANILGSFNTSGNLIAGNITSNGFASINGTLTAANANLGNLATANYFNGTLTTLSSNQSNIQTVGTLNYLNVSSANGGNGNIISINANLGNLAKANFFQGDGGLLTNIGAPNLVFLGNSNINIPSSNGNITVSVTGVSNTIIFTSTGVNVAGYANITGNTNIGSNLVVTSNITSGNASLGNTVTANYINVNNNANITGNLTAGNLIGPHANGNSNVNIPSANGNVNISATGTANVVVVTGTGANIAGTANITGNISAGNASLGNLVTSNYFSGKFDSLSNNQPNITSVGTLLNIVVSANANIGGNLFVGNSSSNVTIANTGVIIATGNITAINANLGNLATANYIAGTLTTAAQPNITSIGTLGNLTVTNNVSANVLTTGTGSNANLTIDPDGTGQLIISSSTPVVMSNSLTSNGDVIFSGANVSLGAVGNISITGGSVNQYLKTDGTGNLSWSTPAGGGGGGGTSLTYTADASPPAGPNIADQWYNTETNTLYEYISDGTSSYWVDIQTPTVTSSAPAAIMVQDEGSNLTYASTLNFTGAGITATNTGNVVTVSVVATETISPFLLMGA